MSRVICVILWLFLFTPNAAAQLNGTFHVFPQIADGRLSDGTSYRTHFIVSNVTSTTTASCTIQLYGISADRLSTPTFTLGLRGIVRLATNDNQSIATGYATLNCNQPVKALALYRYTSSTGVTLGLATVFSSPPNTRSYFLAPTGDRLAIAVANDTDNIQQYDLSARDGSGATIATASLALQPRSSTARYADELMVLPSGFNGAVYINAAGGSTLPSAAFSTIGLAFNGAIFSTLPAFSPLP
jgi:hypothetical protein